VEWLIKLCISLKASGKETIDGFEELLATEEKLIAIMLEKVSCKLEDFSSNYVFLVYFLIP
jgi:hypothetical protein